MSNLYDEPKYYEMAFSFRDISSEIDVLEECFKVHSKIPVRSLLELGCGTCPHMEELVERGYYYNGLDINQRMLEYSRKKASSIAADVHLIHGDMMDFSLKEQFDFIFIALGSLYVKNENELTRHFNSVSEALNKGGLYLLDWFVQFEKPSGKEETWEIEKEDVHVKTRVFWEEIDPDKGTLEETIIVEVEDKGEQHSHTVKDIKKMLYPQEFLNFVKDRKDFDFVGWWNDWNLNQPVEEATQITRPITLLRRV